MYRRDYSPKMQHKPVSHLSAHAEQEQDEHMIEGATHEAVPFRADLTPAQSALQQKEDIRKSSAEGQPVQRSVWGGIDFETLGMTDEEKKKKAEEDERKKAKDQIFHSMPAILHLFDKVNYQAKKTAQIDPNNEAELQKRNKYLKEQYGKMKLYLTAKRDLLPEWIDEEDLALLRQETAFIEEEMTRPLTLSQNYTKLFYNKDFNGLIEESLKINNWLNHNPGHPDAERLRATGEKIIKTTELVKQKPVQNAVDLKYNRWYFIVSNEISRRDLALLMYGDESRSNLLTNFDGSDTSEVLYPGMLVFYNPGVPLTPNGFSSGNMGQVIRSNGEIDQPVSSELLEIKLLKDTYRIPAHLYKSFAKNRLITAKKAMNILGVEGIRDTIKIYNDHKSETNALIRGISHLGSGDFDKGKANGYIRETQGMIDRLEEVDQENLSVEQLISFEEMVKKTKDYSNQVDKDLMAYMNNGISGAETAVKVLEVVKEAGQIAGGFIPGVGIVSGLVFDTVSQASEMAFGMSDQWDWKRTATQGALSVLNKFGGKALDKIPGMETLATKGLAGKFGKEFAQGILLSPAQTITQSLIQEGDVSMDDIIGGLKENFSVKNIATTALGVGVNTYGTKTGLGFGKDKDNAFGSKYLGSQDSPDLIDLGIEKGKKAGMDISKSGSKKTADSYSDTTSDTSVALSAESGNPVPEQTGPKPKASDAPPDQENTTDVLTVDKIRNEHAQFLKENPGFNERLSQLENAPDGKLKRELLLEIMREANSRSGHVEVLDDLPPDTTIFDPDFNPRGDAAELSRHNDFMKKAYHDEVASNRSVEVAIVRNIKTGQMVVIKGEGNQVNVPASSRTVLEMVKDLSSGNDHWALEAHSHPSDPSTGYATALNHNPSSGEGDFGALMYESSVQNNKDVSSFIDYMTPQGPMRTVYGYAPSDPEPFWISIESTKTHTSEIKRFKTLEDYDLHLGINYNRQNGSQFMPEAAIGMDRSSQPDIQLPVSDGVPKEISSDNDKTEPFLKPGTDDWDDKTVPDGQAPVIDGLKNPRSDNWDDDKTPPIGTQKPLATINNESMIAMADQLTDTDGMITLYHGSVKSFSNISEHGFRDDKGSSYFSTERKAAEDAIRSERVERETGLFDKQDAGLIEIKLTKEEFIAILRLGGTKGRSYAGFHDAKLKASEILTDNPEAFRIINDAMKRAPKDKK